MHRISNVIVCRSKPWILVEKVPINQRYAVLPKAMRQYVDQTTAASSQQYMVLPKPASNRYTAPPRRQASATSVMGNTIRPQKREMRILNIEYQGCFNNDHHLMARRRQKEDSMKSENREETKAESLEMAEGAERRVGRRI